MTTNASSTTLTLDVAGIGQVELRVEDRGAGRPFLVLHGGAGPQSVAAFAQLLAEKDVAGTVRNNTSFSRWRRPPGITEEARCLLTESHSHGPFAPR
jgi:hypothetical protein